MKALTVTIVSILALAALVGLMYLSASRNEIRLRNLINAKQDANTAEFDNLKKKISQSVQVTDLQFAMLTNIIVGNANARSAGKGGGTLAAWVQEAVPNVDTSIYKDLMNVIVGSRDSWTQRQTELRDLKREHDNALTVPPSSWFVGNRKPINVIIVTSTDTKAAFQTGEDNDTKLK